MACWKRKGKILFLFKFKLPVTLWILYIPGGKRELKDKWRRILPRFGVKMRLNSFSFITYVNFKISWFDTRPDFYHRNVGCAPRTNLKWFDFKLNLKWDIFISFWVTQMMFIFIRIFNLVNNFRIQLMAKIKHDTLN